MPYIPYEKDPIVVEISDRIDGGTRIKRKALFNNMTYSQTGVGSMFNPGDAALNDDQVILNLTIQLYSAGDLDPVTGEYVYGERLAGKKGFSDYPHHIIANNTTMVDATTGEILCPASEYDAALAQATQESIDVELVLPEVLKGRNFMREGQRFRMVAENYQITVDPMIIDHIQRADIP